MNILWFLPTAPHPAHCDVIDDGDWSKNMPAFITRHGRAHFWRILSLQDTDFRVLTQMATGANSFNTACFHFQFPIQGLIQREKISTLTQGEITKKWFFYKTTMGGTDGSLHAFPPQWTATASWETNKTTVALWEVHSLVLFIFWFICIFYIFQENQSLFFFFTFRYVVS